MELSAGISIAGLSISDVVPVSVVLYRLKDLITVLVLTPGLRKVGATCLIDVVLTNQRWR